MPSPLTRIGRVIPLLLLVGCITEAELKHPSGYEPLAMQDGWEIARPAEVGLDPGVVDAVYRRFFSEKELYDAVAMLIVRDGRLVAEGYARDPAGSFTGDPRAREITLRDLLTMRSGIDLDNHTFATSLLMRRPRDQDRWILARPFYADPGARFFYRDADPQLLSYAVQRRTGRTLEAIALERLFRPLGIREHLWLSNVDGVAFGPDGLWLRPRDLAKLGQLVLDGGVWQERRILSADWIRRATTAQAEVGDDPAISAYRYGYYWWIVPELQAYTAVGHGGRTSSSCRTPGC
jgi:CubicO group peptidase (beta-lactamase class C family)